MDNDTPDQRDVLTPIEHYRIADGLLQDAAGLSITRQHHHRSLLVAEAAVHAELAKCQFDDIQVRPWVFKQG